MHAKGCIDHEVATPFDFFHAFGQGKNEGILSTVIGPKRACPTSVYVCMKGIRSYVCCERQCVIRIPGVGMIREGGVIVLEVPAKQNTSETYSLVDQVKS